VRALLRSFSNNLTPCWSRIIGTRSRSGRVQAKDRDAAKSGDVSHIRNSPFRGQKSDAAAETNESFRFASLITNLDGNAKQLCFRAWWLANHLLLPRGSGHRGGFGRRVDAPRKRKSVLFGQVFSKPYPWSQRRSLAKSGERRGSRRWRPSS
jgi:hypothetical protein